MGELLSQKAYMKNVDKIAGIIREYWPNSEIAVDKSDIDVNFHSGAHIQFNTRVEGRWIRVKFAHHWVKIPTSQSSRDYNHCVSMLRRSIVDYKTKKEAKRTGVLTANKLKDVVSKNVQVSTSQGRVTFSVPVNKAKQAAKLLATL